MAVSSDFVCSSDLDEIFDLIDGGFLEEDDQFNQEIERFVAELPSDDQVSVGFVCDKCEKVCKSRQGLSRHVNAKHTIPSTLQQSSTQTEDDILMNKLHPLKLRVIVTQCAAKVGSDLCLSQQMRENYTGFDSTATQEVELWNKLRVVISKFKGDGEKFFSMFFGLMKDNLLPNHFSETRITNALMQEVCVAILNHLSDNKLNDTTVGVKPVPVSDKEMNSLEYLAGFVIHKLYKKLKYSKVHGSSYYNIQSCFILQACKVECDDSQLLVNARDRGGLWKVGKKVVKIFLQFELL